MALDYLSCISTQTCYLPEFATRNSGRDKDLIFSKLLTCLDDKDNFKNITYVNQYLSQLPVDLYLEPKRVLELVKKIFKIIKHPGIGVSDSTSLIEALHYIVKILKLRYIAPDWMKSSCCTVFWSSQDVNSLGKIVEWEFLFNQLNNRYKRSYDSPVDVASASRKAFVTAIAKLILCCQNLWDSHEIAEKLIQIFDLDNLDTEFSDIYYKTRMMYLFVGSSYWCKSFMNLQPFDWWGKLVFKATSNWEVIWISCFYKGIKHGWGVGNPLNKYICNEQLFFFQHLISLFGIYSEQKITYRRDFIPGEYAPLLAKSLSAIKLYAKVIVYLLIPICESSKFSVSTWNLLESLVAVLFPYTHPNSAGKWSTNISLFFSTLSKSYLKRIGRERLGESIIKNFVGRDIETNTDLRLNREDDERFINAILPLILQGLHTQQIQTASYYESCVKSLICLNPSKIITTVVERILEILESITEPQALQSALRLCVQIFPLLIHYKPDSIPLMIEAMLPGIDSADPMKTMQVLTFLGMFFQRVGCHDLSDCDISKIDYSSLSQEFNNVLFSGTTGFVSYINYPKDSDKLHEKQFWTESAFKEKVNSIVMFTMVFPSWVVSFFESILILIVNIVNNGEAPENILEKSYITLIDSTLSAVFHRCDKAIMTNLLNIFIDWAEKYTLRSFSKYAAMITRLFCAKSPELCFEKLFQFSYNKLKRFLHQTETSDLTESDIEIISWHLSMISNCIRCKQEFIRSVKCELKKILVWSLCHIKPRIARLGGKIARRIIDTLIQIQINTSDLSAEPSIYDVYDLLWYNYSDYNHLGHLLFGFTEKKDKKASSSFYWIQANKHALSLCEEFLKFYKSILLNFLNYLDMIDFGLLENMDKADILKELELVGLKPNLRQHSTASSLNQVLRLVRYIIKSISSYYPSNRASIEHDSLTVTPKEIDFVRDFQSFAVSILLKISRDILNFHSDEKLQTMSKLSVNQKLKPSEEYKSSKLLLKAIHQHVARTPPNTTTKYYEKESSTKIDLQNTSKYFPYISWFSMCSGIHPFSDIQDCTSNVWIYQILHEWESRMENCKLDQEFTACQHELLLIATYFATEQYSENRKIAQNLIQSMILYYPKSISIASNYYINSLKSISDTLINQHKTFNSKETDQHDKLEAALKAKMIGLSYCLDNASIQKHLWRMPSMTCAFLKAFTYILNTQISDKSVWTRFFHIAEKLLNNREIPALNESDKISISEEFLNPLFVTLSSTTNQQWKFQLFSTAILAIFNQSSLSLMKDKYLSWLLKICLDVSVYPLVSTLAIFCLTLFLAKDQDLLSSAKYVLLEDHTFHKLTEVLVKANHESCSNVTTKSTPETAEQIILPILKIDCTWPRHRRPCASAHISLHNCVAVHNISFFQYKLSEKSLTVFERWSNEAEKLLRHEPSDMQSQVTACEILAGCLKTCFYNSIDQNAIWNTLEKVVSLSLSILNQERFTEFLDMILFSFDDLDKDKTISALNTILPFLLNTSLSKMSESLNKSQCTINLDTVQNSFELTKILAICRLLYQLTGKFSHLVANALLPILSQLMCHPYDQVRRETSGLVSTMLKYKSCLDELAQQDLQTLLDLMSIEILERFKESKDLTRPMELKLDINATKTTCSIISLLYRQSLDHYAYDFILKSIPYIFEATQSIELESLANLTLKYIFGSQINMICPSDISHLQFINSLIEQLKVHQNSKNWNLRKLALQLSYKLSVSIQFQCYNSDALKRLIEQSFEGLTDEQFEVREAAEKCMTALLISLPSSKLEEYISLFTTIRSNDRNNNMQNVIGLSSLIKACPYHVPEWLPNAITCLAKYGHGKADDSIRKKVQKTLQEFMKSHSDAWHQVYSKKFTEDQLSILETYRGQPIYFA